MKPLKQSKSSCCHYDGQLLFDCFGNNLDTVVVVAVVVIAVVAVVVVVIAVVAVVVVGRKVQTWIL